MYGGKAVCDRTAYMPDIDIDFIFSAVPEFVLMFMISSSSCILKKILYINEYVTVI